MFANGARAIWGVAVNGSWYILKVARTADPVDSRAGYHAIGDFVIYGVAVISHTDDTLEGCHSFKYRVWIRNGQD